MNEQKTILVGLSNPRTADHLVGSLETIFRNLAHGPGAALDLLG